MNQKQNSYKYDEIPKYYHKKSNNSDRNIILNKKVSMGLRNENENVRGFLNGK